MKKVFFLLAIASVFTLKHFVFQETALYELPKLLSSSRSKEFCSCYFILKRDENYCLEKVRKSYPVFSYKIDKVKKEVTFSNFLSSSTAKQLKEPKFGCLLI